MAFMTIGLPFSGIKLKASHRRQPELLAHLPAVFHQRTIENIMPMIVQLKKSRCIIMVNMSYQAIEQP